MPFVAFWLAIHGLLASRLWSLAWPFAVSRSVENHCFHAVLRLFAIGLPHRCRWARKKERHHRFSLPCKDTQFRSLFQTIHQNNGHFLAFFLMPAAFGQAGLPLSAAVAAALCVRGCALYGRRCALGGRGCALCVRGCVGCCIAATPPPCALPPQPCRSIGLRLPFSPEHVERVLGQGAHLVLPRVDMHGRHPFDALPQPRHHIA